MLAVVRPPGLAVCWQLEGAHLLTRGEQPRDAAWTSLIPVEACRPHSLCYHAPFRDSRTAFSISRRVSFSRRAERLSWSFLPRASPISSFARPLLKYRRS